MPHRTRPIMIAIFLLATMSSAFAEDAKAAQAEAVQAQAILTVSEGKRLIAKAVAQMPAVKKAMQDGMISSAGAQRTPMWPKNSQDKKSLHGSYVVGWTGPAKGGKTLPAGERQPISSWSKGRCSPISAWMTP